MKISQIALWAVIFLICIVILSLTSSSLISNKLEQQIPQFTFGTFKAKVQDVNVNIITGNISIHDAQLYDTLGPGLISLPEIKLKNIKVLKLLINKEIALSKIVIDSAIINIYLDKDNQLIIPENKNKSSKYNLGEIGLFQINKASLTINKQDSIAVGSIYKTQIDLDLWEIAANESKQYSYNSLNFDSLSFYLQDGLYQFGNKLYSIYYNTIGYNTHNSNLNIDQLLLKSNYSQYEIGKQTGTETDWLDFTIQDIVVENILLNNLLKDTALISSQIRIKNFTGFAFKDKRLPLGQKPDTKLPMELFNSLPLAFHIDSAVIEDANIEYSERAPNSQEAGVVTFNNLTAIIKNLSNIESLITAPTTMQARAKVMDKGTLAANFIFPNIKYPESYSAKGHLNSMSMEAFNPILKQNASVIIKSGEFKHLEFDFQYNNEQSKGELRFEYEGLKIALLDQSKSKVKTTKTFLANNILLNQDNLATEKSFRTGEISFNRNKKRSVFNFWWKSILSGIKSTAL